MIPIGLIEIFDDVYKHSSSKRFILHLITGSFFLGFCFEDLRRVDEYTDLLSVEPFKRSYMVMSLKSLCPEEIVVFFRSCVVVSD